MGSDISEAKVACSHIAIFHTRSTSPTAPRAEVMAAKDVDYKIVPKVRAEDDDDPAEEIKAKCESANCQKYKDRYDECNARVASKKETEETCLEEVMDLFHCVDHCAAPKIMANLK